MAKHFCMNVISCVCHLSNTLSPQIPPAGSKKYDMSMVFSYMLTIPTN